MNTSAITLGNEELTVEVWPLGARLNGVWFQGKGNLVDGARNREEAVESKKYNGAVVGPVANRIAEATAEIDSEAFHFEKNERQRTTLHSGSDGVHARDWSIDYADDALLILKLALKDGEGGFPGNRLLAAHFHLIGNALTVHLEASTDAPSWLNLALHPYWALGLNGRAGQRMRINADHYLPVDDFQIPTGEIANVAHTRFDLREIAVPSTEIDHNFCLNETNGPAVVIESDAGIRMDIETDAPGVQIYSGKDIGIAIEPQHWPDAMHHPHFPSVEVRPGETYRQVSTYRFSQL